jgi:hypothetical protein
MFLAAALIVAAVAAATAANLALLEQADGSDSRVGHLTRRSSSPATAHPLPCSPTQDDHSSSAARRRPGQQEHRGRQ